MAIVSQFSVVSVYLLLLVKITSEELLSADGEYSVWLTSESSLHCSFPLQEAICLLYKLNCFSTVENAPSRTPRLHDDVGYWELLLCLKCLLLWTSYQRMQHHQGAKLKHLSLTGAIIHCKPLSNVLNIIYTE